MRPPDTSSKKYIHRTKYVSELRHLVQTSQKQIRVGDTQALYGLGKTTTLAHFYYELKKNSSFSPIWIPFDQYSISYTNNKTQDFNSLESTIQNFQNFWHLLIDLGASIDDVVFSKMKDQLENISDKAIMSLMEMQKRTISPNIKSGDIDISTWAQIAGHGVVINSGDVNLSINIDDKAIIDVVLGAAVEKFIQIFVAFLNSRPDAHKIILFADDFDWVIDQKLGDWFLHLTKSMDDVIVLTARAVLGREIYDIPTTTTSLQLDPFSFDETFKYLVDRLPVEAIQKEQIEYIYNFSNGIPLLVSLIGDLLANKIIDVNSFDSLVQFLGRESNKTATQEASFNNLVEELYRKLDGMIKSFDKEILHKNSQSRFIFHVGGIARQFDEDLLVYISKKLDVLFADSTQVVQKVNVKQIIGLLPHYSFIQRYTTGTGKTTYRFHHLMRKRIETYLESFSANYVDSFHKLIAEYYLESSLQHDIANADKSFYARMYRIEHTEWQTAVIEWVYHLGKVKKREETRLQLSKLYFEAFDWWGWYLPFKFCDDILTVWEQTQPDEDQDVLDLIRDFHFSYPIGYEKYGVGDWETVQVSLDNIVFELDLDYPPEKLSSVQRSVRGLISRYLAEAFMYKDEPEYINAENHYKDALQYFEDDWNKMWIHAYLGDMYYKYGKEKLAFEHVNRSIEMAKEDNSFAERDQELLSLAYRILGDLFLKKGKIRETFCSYFYCVLHSYIFNFIQNDPDAYTMKWYDDMGSHVSQALLNLYTEEKQQIAIDAFNLFLSLWPNFMRSDIGIKDLEKNEKIIDILQNEQRDVLKSILIPAIPQFPLEKKSVRIARSKARRLHLATLKSGEQTFRSCLEIL